MHRTKLATGRVNDILALCEELRTFTHYSPPLINNEWCRRGKLSEYMDSNFSFGKESFPQSKVT